MIPSDLRTRVLCFVHGNNIWPQNKLYNHMIAAEFLKVLLLNSHHNITHLFDILFNNSLFVSVFGIGGHLGGWHTEHSSL